MKYFIKVFAFKVSALYLCYTIKANGYENRKIKSDVKKQC